MKNKLTAAMLIIACLMLSACGFEKLDVTDDAGNAIWTNSDERITSQFIEIGGGLYYDPNTMIVWLRNGISSGYESPIYVPYIGPNGFPYRYDADKKIFMQTGMPQEEN